MPLFHFKVIDSSGKHQKGFIEAFDERDAKIKLKEQGVFITALSSNTSYSTHQKISGDDLVNISGLLSQLVSSGIPLYESLLAIEEQYRGTKFHRILVSLAEQVKGGTRLSAAMNSFPESFDKLFVAMIAAGESAGALDIVLEKLSILLTKQALLKKEITTAMIYPLILGGFALTVISVLLGFVIPSIEGIFEGKTLNGFTQFVINLSHFARNWWWVYIPLFLGAIGAMVWQFKNPKFRLWTLSRMIRVPLIGNIIIISGMSRFCRTMGTLLTGGLPMIEALRLATKTIGNPSLENEMQQAEDKIVAGSQLSHELLKSKLIPPLIPRMLSIGEETGHLTTMLNKVADIYEQELDKTLKRTLALMQPVILLVMGFIVGMVMIAILLPLTDLSSLQ